MASTAGRTYVDAIALLDSLRSNAPRDINLDAIPEMLDWTRKAGYDVSDFAKRQLKCIYVTGKRARVVYA
jgi:folylpolyglutamate synthase